MRNNNSNRWTHDDVIYLREKKDLPLREVAEKLGRSIYAIKSKRMELGLKREKIKDLTGKRFTRLIVLRENGRMRRRVAWLCKCDCGKEVTVSSNHLLSGDTKSCGCYSRDRASEGNSLNLTGQQFGHLTVIEQNGRTNIQQIKWLCECVCGNQTTVVSNNLVSGNTESCGCNRELNQRQGIAWEELVKKYLDYKFLNIEYHVQLPNLKRPDFFIPSEKIILDAKRHDYLRIEECIKKYASHAEKLIFICMIKRRTDWKVDFNHSERIEFWYPEDLLTWIPETHHEEFLAKIQEINEMWINEDQQKKNLNIQQAIERLEEKNSSIIQETVANEMGTGRNIFRERPELAEYLKNYLKDMKIKDENQFIFKLQEIIKLKLEKGDRITYQGIAKTILETIQSKETGPSHNQQLWALSKQLSDIPRFKQVIWEEQQTIELIRRGIIRESIIQLNKENKKITLFEIQKLTGISKHFLYGSEIKQFVKNILKKYSK